MPEVFFSTSLSVVRLRSSISCSVTTVTDCGTSRKSCSPLPMVVRRARRPSSFSPLTVTGCRVVVGAVTGCAPAAREPASNNAPSGSAAPDTPENVASYDRLALGLRGNSSKFVVRDTASASKCVG